MPLAAGCRVRKGRSIMMLVDMDMLRKHSVLVLPAMAYSKKKGWD